MVPEEGQLSVNYSLGQSVALGPQKAVEVIFVQLKAFRKIFNGDIHSVKSLSVHRDGASLRRRMDWSDSGE